MAPTTLTRMMSDTQTRTRTTKARVRLALALCLRQDPDAHVWAKEQAFSRTLPWLLHAHRSENPVKLGAHHPKPEGVAAARQSAAVPTGNSHVPDVIVPATAAYNAVSPRRRAHWIRLRPRAVAAILVPEPLPHISTHIVQAKTARRFCLRRMRHVPAVHAIPRQRCCSHCTRIP